MMIILRINQQLIKNKDSKSKDKDSKRKDKDSKSKDKDNKGIIMVKCNQTSNSIIYSKISHNKSTYSKLGSK